MFLVEKVLSRWWHGGGRWWHGGGTVVASAGRLGGIRGAARLRQKLSEFDRF